MTNRPVASFRAAAVGFALALAAPLLAAPLSPKARMFGLAAFALVACVAQARIAAHHPFDRLGLANAVTLGRAAGVGALFALAADAPADPDVAVAALGLSTVLIALDGLDGWLARRQGLASNFGARFDMEVDALAILALCWLALGLGKAGPWVLGIGLMRYAFVLAGLAEPRLAAPLPPSTRRKAICVLQLVALTTLLAPQVTPPVSTGIALFALAALTWSFAVDLRWLADQP